MGQRNIQVFQRKALRVLTFPCPLLMCFNSTTGLRVNKYSYRYKKNPYLSHFKFTKPIVKWLLIQVISETYRFTFLKTFLRNLSAFIGFHRTHFFSSITHPPPPPIKFREMKQVMDMLIPVLIPNSTFL